jgi:hypothetical protein
MLEKSGRRVAFQHRLDVSLQAIPGRVAPKSSIRAIGLLVWVRLGLAGPADARGSLGVWYEDYTQFKNAVWVHAHRVDDCRGDHRPANHDRRPQFGPGARPVTIEHDLQQFASA